MGLVIDNSGSMREKRTKVEAAALALVKDSNPQDEVFIVNFNDEAFLDRDFTNDPKDLQEGLARIDSRGGTAMRDAIRMSIDHLKEKAKKDKKVLVVVTDGNDNSSLISIENLVKSAQDSGVLVYTVGLLNEEEKREAKKCKRALEELASVTGGESYFPKELAEVDRVAHQVAHDIRNQYILAYTPVNVALDGSFRQIKVTANGPNRPVVRTRSGYYATPDGINGSTSARNGGSN
jgi:VWFA-related protein